MAAMSLGPIHCKMARLLTLFSLSLILPAVALCQVDTGSISGTVRDTSGSVIPGVNVTLTNSGTGQSISTTTKSAGEYTFSPVRIGQYSVSAEMTGFEKDTTEQCHRRCATKSTSRPLDDLGKDQRDGDGGRCAPRAANAGCFGGAGDPGSSNRRPAIEWPRFCPPFLTRPSRCSPRPQNTPGLRLQQLLRNGLRRPASNYCSTESTTIPTWSTCRRPAAKTMEIRRSSSSRPTITARDTGRSAGAVLNATIKSGTNQFHGAAWEFFRNDALDAANYFENANGLKVDFSRTSSSHYSQQDLLLRRL